MNSTTFNLSFTIAYKDETVKEIGIVKDDAGFRLLSGTQEELGAAIKLPKFVDFMAALSMTGNFALVSDLPPNVQDYVFRFSAVIVGTDVHVYGGSSVLDNEVITDVPIIAMQELLNDEDFTSLFQGGGAILIKDGYAMSDSSHIGGPVYTLDSEMNPNWELPFQEADGGGGLDDYGLTMDLPFTFIFFGNEYNAIQVNTNGYIQPLVHSGDQTFNSCCGQQEFPAIDDGILPAMIAPLWADLYLVHDRSAIAVGTFGEAPNRRFVVYFWQMGGCCVTNDNLLFQVALYEGPSGGIRFQYEHLGILGGTDPGEYARAGVVGINKGDGIKGLTYLSADSGDTEASNSTPLATTMGIPDEFAVGFVIEGKTPPWPI